MGFILLMENKRGQDFSITALLLIVLGVVVVAVIILGFVKGWDFVFGKFDLLPGQTLETIAQSCNIAGKGQLRVDYCQFKNVKIDGEKQYINCMDGRLGASIEEPLTCESPYTIGDKCRELATDAGDKCRDVLGKTKVNNGFCDANTYCGVQPLGPPTPS